MKAKKIIVFIVFSVLAFVCKTSTASIGSSILSFGNEKVSDDATQQQDGTLFAMMCHKK